MYKLEVLVNGLGALHKKTRGVFWTPSIIYDGVCLRKKITGFSRQLFSQKHSAMTGSEILFRRLCRGKFEHYERAAICICPASWPGYIAFTHAFACKQTYVVNYVVIAYLIHFFTHLSFG